MTCRHNVIATTLLFSITNHSYPNTKGAPVPATSRLFLCPNKGRSIMPKSVEICQFVTRTIKRTIWKIPRIRDGSHWRDIENSHLVENPVSFFSHDRYEEAIFRAKRIMEKRGWKTELTDFKELCIENLTYQHYRLKCWKSS